MAEIIDTSSNPFELELTSKNGKKYVVTYQSREDLEAAQRMSEQDSGEGIGADESGRISVKWPAPSSRSFDSNSDVTREVNIKWYEIVEAGTFDWAQWHFRFNCTRGNMKMWIHDEEGDEYSKLLFGSSGDLSYRSGKPAIVKIEYVNILGSQ